MIGLNSSISADLVLSLSHNRRSIMARKIRMTPFARFFIFLLIAAPLAFIGASYFRGEDGIAKIKSLLEQFKGDTQINEVNGIEGQANEIQTTEIQNTELQSTEVLDKQEELDTKLDSILQNQKRIIKILETNQKNLSISQPDSL
jgi:cell division protein FtsB